MDATQTKQDTRSRMLALRRGLAPIKRAALSAAVCANVRSTRAWRRAGSVLCYMPVQGEVDVRELVDELWARGSRVLLPRCRPDEPGVMDVACATCADDLCAGAYGILEPDAGACPAEDEASPDLVLVPGVAFDRRGMRLGFGAGFYDRFLSGGQPSGRTLFGVAYAFQVLETLPADPWDVPVQAVITENDILWT